MQGAPAGRRLRLGCSGAGKRIAGVRLRASVLRRTIGYECGETIVTERTDQPVGGEHGPGSARGPVDGGRGTGTPADPEATTPPLEPEPAPGPGPNETSATHRRTERVSPGRMRRLAGLHGGQRTALIAGELSGRLLGKYRLRQHLGRGGMGVVYEAEQISS